LKVITVLVGAPEANVWLRMCRPNKDKKISFADEHGKNIADVRLLFGVVYVIIADLQSICAVASV
jgi:hypothetical protein